MAVRGDELLGAGAEHALIQVHEDHVELRTRPLGLLTCVAGTDPVGQSLVAITLGSNPFEPADAISLTLCDARRLLSSLRNLLEPGQVPSS